MKTIEMQVRNSATLIDRLLECNRRICEMASNGNPPKMQIPPHWNDDDIFITSTISDAISTISGITIGAVVPSV